MSKKVPCSKCGKEYTTQGIKNHESRCDGTISEPDEIDHEGNVWETNKLTGTKTYFPDESEKVQEIRNREIHEHISTSDVGSGAVIVVILIIAGLYFIISHIKDIIPTIKNKEDTPIPEPDTNKNIGWI